MKTYIRRREKNDSLVVLFGAWGTDENVFVPFCNDEFDFILFYNYSADQALVLPEMKTYRKIVVIGWSLGVWAAEYLSPSTGIIPDVTIAVNGTPVPLDDHYGIPARSFEESLNNITEESMDKFYYRMFGNRRTYNLNSDKIPHRTLESVHVEMRWLYNRIMEQKDPGFQVGLCSNKRIRQDISFRKCDQLLEQAKGYQTDNSSISPLYVLQMEFLRRFYKFC